MLTPEDIAAIRERADYFAFDDERATKDDFMALLAHIEELEASIEHEKRKAVDEFQDRFDEK